MPSLSLMLVVVGLFVPYYVLGLVLHWRPATRLRVVAFTLPIVATLFMVIDLTRRGFTGWTGFSILLVMFAVVCYEVRYGAQDRVTIGTAETS
jgi:drug/metabolite transporter (DMT)-like permease